MITVEDALSHEGCRLVFEDNFNETEPDYVRVCQRRKSSTEGMTYE